VKSPGTRALLLLAELVASVEQATKNPILNSFLKRSAEGQKLLAEARGILRDAHAELADPVRQAVEGEPQSTGERRGS
jgi:hypothetical protein